MRGFAKKGFSLSEITITLVLLGVVASLSGFAIKAMDRAKGDQSKRVVEGAIMELNAAKAKFLAAGGYFPQDNTFNHDTILRYLDGKRVTTPIDLTSAINCNTAGHTCVQLKNGAIILWCSACGGIGGGIHIDPDGKQSTTSPAPEESKPVNMLISLRTGKMLVNGTQPAYFKSYEIVSDQTRFQ